MKRKRRKKRKKRKRKKKKECRMEISFVYVQPSIIIWVHLLTHR